MKPPIALALPLFAVFACAAIAPYLPPEEKPECSDEQAALILANCRAKTRAARAANDLPALDTAKAECRAAVDKWEACR